MYNVRAYNDFLLFQIVDLYKFNNVA